MHPIKVNLTLICFCDVIINNLLKWSVIILVIIKLMAFVCEAERKLNEISKTMCPLGPGQYFKD